MKTTENNYGFDDYALSSYEDFSMVSREQLEGCDIESIKITYRKRGTERRFTVTQKTRGE